MFVSYLFRLLCVENMLFETRWNSTASVMKATLQFTETQHTTLCLRHFTTNNVYSRDIMLHVLHTVSSRTSWIYIRVLQWPQENKWCLLQTCVESTFPTSERVPQQAYIRPWKPVESTPHLSKQPFGCDNFSRGNKHYPFEITSQGQWATLDETGHGGSRDRTRGWLLYDMRSLWVS